MAKSEHCRLSFHIRIAGEPFLLPPTCCAAKETPAAFSFLMYTFI
jgi:hypothetical protein